MVDEQDESQIEKAMAWVVDQAVGGVSVAGREVLASAEGLADTYRDDASRRSVDDAIDALIAWETSKSFTAGFVAGLAGAPAMIIAIPADMTASWIIQTRMVAAIAILRGHDVHDERVRTFILMALVADSIKEVLAQAGIKVGEKVALKAVQRIPGAALKAINKAVGFRLVARFGAKTPIVLGKAVPIVGGLIGGTIDATACYGIGHTAKALFGDGHAPPGPDATPEPDHPPAGAAV